MNEVLKFLQANPLLYLATVGTNGKAKCRPFMFFFEQEGKLWFCTSNEKQVYRDMQKNPNVEFCAADQSATWLRIAGKAIFKNDLAIKEAVLAKSELVRKLFQTADNPTLEVFYLADAHSVISDFSGRAA